MKHFGMRAAGHIAWGLRTTLGSRAGERIGILTYHRVAARVPGLPKPLHNVSPARFKSQIEGLLRRGVRFQSLQAVLECRAAGKPLPPGTVVLTFDDGYASVFTEAFPVLAKLGVPSTLFLTTGYLDSHSPFPFDRWGVEWETQAPRDSFRPLTTEECRQMHDSGWLDLGAHTHTHQDFRNRETDFREDMVNCLQTLESCFGLKNPTFALPYGTRHEGFAGDELLDACRDLGVPTALTTEPALVNLKQDPLGWGRFNVFDWDTAGTLAGKLAGWYSWAPRFWRAAARVFRPGAERQAATLPKSLQCASGTPFMRS